MIEFTLNNNSISVDVDPQKPLLWVIREDCNLTGSKYGCGKGLCGACTVQLNGVAVRSCLTPIASVAGQKVTTIEGLSDDASHPLQQAWLAENVMQCGYCQPGQLMTADALLKQKPSATEAEIRAAMQGNLCRCGTYPRIIDAIVKVATDN